MTTGSTETGKGVKGKVRTQRRIIYEQIRDELRALGYDPICKYFHHDKYMRYRLIVIAVNHLAEILHREPIRVYQALACRAYRTIRGVPHLAYKQARPPQGAELDVGFVGVRCPRCGMELIEAGEITEREVLREKKPQKSPQNK
nr:MAG TPA: hypothetical protein [Caudoviricetes sp.]